MSKRRQGVPTRQVENEHVIVTHWHFSPGAETGWHRHEHAYVIVPLADGQLELADESGSRLAALAAGQSYFRSSGVEHNVINANAFDFAFIEIEVKANGRS